MSSLFQLCTINVWQKRHIGLIKLEVLGVDTHKGYLLAGNGGKQHCTENISKWHIVITLTISRCKRCTPLYMQWNLLYRPLAYICRPHSTGRVIFFMLLNFHIKTTYEGHSLWVPRVVFIYKLHCIYNFNYKMMTSGMTFDVQIMVLQF